MDVNWKCLTRSADSSRYKLHLVSKSDTKFNDNSQAKYLQHQMETEMKE